MRLAIVLLACALASFFALGCSDNRALDDPCEGVDCSFQGMCAEEHGEPYCLCYRGFVPDGLECVPESDGDADGDADGDVDGDGDTDGDADGDVDGDVDGDADGDGDADPCGDGVCTDGEDLCSCPADCDVCSDGVCSSSEAGDGSCAADCSESGQWIRLCPGTFTMGSPPDEVGREAGVPYETAHSVTLSSSFEIYSTEVTQAEYVALMGYSPSYFTACGGNCPVENLSWHEAAAYCNALSAVGEECYDCTGGGATVNCAPSEAHASPYACPGYRLPTEAEWEYAARAGTTTATYNGDLDVEDCSASAVVGPIAWYCGNSGPAPGSRTPHEVGALAANAWGLHDMLGNVFEWCHDWYVDDLGSSAVTDPSGPASGILRITRGGGWDNNARRMRAAYRTFCPPRDGSYLTGFRPVRSRP